MWFFSRKRASHPLKELEETRERVQRLEIRVLELDTDLQGVAQSHHKLLKRTVGQLGGRPPTGSNGGGIDQVPLGDKDGLRRALAGELSARARGNIPKE